MPVRMHLCLMCRMLMVVTAVFPRMFMRVPVVCMPVFVFMNMLMGMLVLVGVFLPSMIMLMFM